MPKKGGDTFTMREMTELLQHIAVNMVTKQDVREVVTEVVQEIVPPMIEEGINRLVPPMIERLVPPMIEDGINRLVPPMLSKQKHEIMDYVDRKDREYKGELTLRIIKIEERVGLR